MPIQGSLAWRRLCINELKERMTSVDTRGSNQQSQQFKPNRKQRRDAARWQREQETAARIKAAKKVKKPRAKEVKATKQLPPQPTVMYECDPVKNAGCPKTSCFLGGGPCHQTTKLEFARQPVKTAHMVVPVDEATRQDLVRQYAAELREGGVGDAGHA